MGDEVTRQRALSRGLPRERARCRTGRVYPYVNMRESIKISQIRKFSAHIFAWQAKPLNSTGRQSASMETATDKDIGVSGSYSWHLLFFAKLIIYHEIEGKRRENLT